MTRDALFDASRKPWRLKVSTLDFQPHFGWLAGRTSHRSGRYAQLESSNYRTNRRRLFWTPIKLEPHPLLDSPISRRTRSYLILRKTEYSCISARTLRE